MSSKQKLLEKILRGSSDENISFKELCTLLVSLGFQERIKGSHHIYSYPGIEEIINIQPKGMKAKGYQVKQIRNVIVNYKLAEEE